MNRRLWPHKRIFTGLEKLWISGKNYKDAGSSIKDVEDDRGRKRGMTD